VRGFRGHHRGSVAGREAGREVERLHVERLDRGRVIGIADRLEKIVADDLWPLPKYEEMLFIK
jgi:glutamine synthetase type III